MPKWVRIIMDPGGTITDSITKNKTLDGTPLKLKEAADTAFNIAIQAAIVAITAAVACIFISAAWPVITAIALAGVAAAALATGITCISIACYKANKEDNDSDTSSKKTSNDNDHPDNTHPALVSNHNKPSAAHSSHHKSLTKSNSEALLPTINSDNEFPIEPSIDDSQQVYTRYFSLMQQAYSDQQAHEHAEEAKQNLGSIKTALQTQNGIDTSAINSAIEALSQNTICLLSITSIPMKEITELIQRPQLSNAESSNGQAEHFNAEQTTPPAYLNDIFSENQSTVQNGIKAALGLDKILQEENGESQNIQTILANIEKVEQQIDTIAQDIKQKQSTLQNLRQTIDLAQNRSLDD